MKILIEIYKTLNADFGKGCYWSFVDKFVFRWYKNYVEPKIEMRGDKNK